MIESTPSHDRHPNDGEVVPIWKLGIRLCKVNDEIGCRGGLVTMPTALDPKPRSPNPRLPSEWVAETLTVSYHCGTTRSAHLVRKLPETKVFNDFTHHVLKSRFHRTVVKVGGRLIAFGTLGQVGPVVETNVVEVVIENLWNL